MNKTNAKKECLNITKGYKVISSVISFGDSSYNEETSEFKLKPLYSDNDWKDFMKFLNKDYDSGYGGQELFGFIFCDDGVWMSRGEYDGAEWWEIHKYPSLRDFFDEKDVLKFERNKKISKIKETKPS